MKQMDITLLRQLVRYEPETGRLYWLKRDVSLFADGYRGADHNCRRWNTRFCGKEALTNVEAYGCKSGRILGEIYKAHRVAWAVFHGEWPSETIDHINGDSADNRMSNLRDVPIAVNVRNKGLYASNISGCHGVSWYKPRRQWVSTIRVGGKRTHLGYFDDLDAAIAARRNAERGAFHKNHGRAA